jgi:hypothetical protein
MKTNENTKLFLVDGTNNNKVVSQFQSVEEINDYLNKKKFSSFDWSKHYESFEDYKDEFFIVSLEEMNISIEKYGSRVLNYWT